MPNKIYFDYASTTSLSPEIYDQYVKLLKNCYVNSESMYDDGLYVKQLLNQARHSLATSLSILPQEIIFTSGASESNNLAIKGVCFKHLESKHIVTSAIEHSSVLECYRQLERLFGYEVTIIPVNQSGFYDLKVLEKSLRKDTILVSLMWVNNEVGTIQKIDEIKTILKKFPKCHLHIDAVQALGKIPLDLNDIDLVTFSAHKIHGLKGSGLLIKKSNVFLEPLIIAGQQESGLRGGTTDATVHIMFAKTMRLAIENMHRSQQRRELLKQYLIKALSCVKNLSFNSPLKDSVMIVNVSTPLKSEIMLNALNQKGIMISALSTCHSSKTTSHVLEAMKIDDQCIKNSIRISLDDATTYEEIDQLIISIEEAIGQYATSKL